jgi:UDP-N-acetylmuramyl pentapeptide phosphotransferase/UDP-N-acetylglucosamine-1-phosphate transferase
MGWVDNPEKHLHVKHTHQKAVPRGGGLVIILTVLLASSLFLSFDKYFIAFLGCALILASVVVFYDIFDISPYI